MQERRKINGAGKGGGLAGNGLALFYFARPLWQRGVMIGLLAFAVGAAFDALMHLWAVLLGWEWMHERLGKNIIEGMVLGYVAYGLARLREQRLARRMKEIGYLNHHIRNALQAIELAAYQLQDARERAHVVDEEVRRVTATLSKVTRAEDEGTELDFEPKE